MSSGLSIGLYRVLMRAYPREFRLQYGESIDQAFRDMHRDALQQRGYLGIALLWFHVVPDFLFSAGEVLLAKAGDFLKWRFRLQWVLACSAGFALARAIFLLLGVEFLRGLRGSALIPAIFMSSLGLMQSRVLAGRCFRKKQWVLYGLAGAVFATLIFSGRAFGPLLQLLVNVSPPLNQVTPSIPLIIWGALVGALQSAAIRNDAITRYRWMKACMGGYFVSAVAGGFVIPINPMTGSPWNSVFQLVLTSFVAGAFLGLLTSGPLEQILFSIQADSKGQQ